MTDKSKPATKTTARTGKSPAGQPKKPAKKATDAETQEIGGPKGPDPTRYGDWEKGGRCIDF